MGDIPTSVMIDGILTYTHKYATRRLTVHDSRITASEPPSEWPLGSNATQVAMELAALGVAILWEPLDPIPEVPPVPDAPTVGTDHG